jgi:hypothetical protein
MIKLSGLVFCHICMHGGPGANEPFALPGELETAALKDGWRFRNGWICRECLSGARPVSPTSLEGVR